MIIDNIRKGHACNSSSTHTFFIPKNKLNTDEYSQFGWDFFTVAPQDIRYYLGATIHSNFHDLPIEVINKRLGIILDTDPSESVYVDHQSCLAIPHNYKGDIDWQFIEELIEFFENNNIAVGGGNDNTSEQYNINGGKEIQIPVPVECRDYISRKDGNQWIFFNKKTGDKVRFRFDDSKELVRPSAPELVDIKITDHCKFECAYCYQGSTKEGKHADLSHVFSILYTLADMKVFEIAIGGGEPTSHPDFKLICQQAKALGIVPNFTTRNITWCRNNFEFIREVCGTVAFSVDSATQTKKVLALCELGMRINIQVVPGAIGNSSLKEIFKICNANGINLTLLGYKHQERGIQFKPLDYAIWIELVNATYGVNMDTAFLKLHKDDLLMMVGNSLYHKCANEFEGAYSCYIDAVTNRIAPSSFCDSSLYQSLDHMTIQQGWNLIQPL